MNKVFYLSVLNTNPEVLPYDGVMKKIMLHIKTLESYGNEVDYIESDGTDTYFVSRNDKDKICSFSNGGFEYFNKVVISASKYITINKLKYDYIYIRHDAFSLKGYNALKVLYKHSSKIYLEIPTYFVPTKSIKNFVKYYFDKHLKKYVHRIVTDCNEQCIFGIPTIMITNGVDIEKIIPRTPTYDECINVALVASISDYHGVNKIISAVEKEKVDRNIIFHIVGDGPKLKEYRDQIKEKHLEKSVVLYGKLTGQELDAVFNKCELGISSLANKEIGVLFSSTLKSKEYLSKGLPIISDVMLDVFYDNPKFYFINCKMILIYVN